MNNKTSIGSRIAEPAPAGPPPVGGVRDLSEVKVPARVGRWAIRLVHLNAGWRYWVFEHSGAGDELSPEGYPTAAEAFAAAKANP